MSLSGGNSGSFDNQLVFATLPGGATTHYVATYSFRAIGSTNTATTLSPVVDIASGSQIKHTNTNQGAYSTGLLPVEPASNTVLLSKLVSAATLPAQGGTVTYTLRVTNSSGYAIVLMDDFQDTLPAGAAYVANSSTFNGSAIANPTQSGQVLTWSSPFSARPSIVVTSWPSACTASAVHDFTDSPSSRTVHAPHDDVSQPTFVPLSPSWLRRK